MARTATRTANIYTRVDPDTKEQAEAKVRNFLSKGYFIPKEIKNFTDALNGVKKKK